ncbi:MAG TPA: winged helix-turn-helix domain-containing protein, partial [Phenylobacterium sp.]|nr:winged helix-turn-helix domain-containing protein [Phenylobacterium sp.]
MTDRAIDWAEIALPREEAFSLAGTQVRPAALEVEHAGRATTLEPRVMKVLTALHRSLGQPVSRDELIAACWGGRIVTEGAINRCIAQLRKALAPNPRIRVDTIATVGYRLQASAEVHRVGGAASDPAPEASTTVCWTRQPLVWALVGLAVLAAAGGGLWMQLAGRPVVWTASAFRPLTSDPGVETYPALSPNGQQLVYAARSRSDERRDLFLRGIEDGAPVRLTSSPGDESSAAWSPRGDRIAFVRYPGYGACTIVVMPVPGGAERTAAACQATTGTRVSWLDDNTLVISDRPTTADARRLRTIDIATGATRDLTTPPANSLGDSEPQVSPDGKRLVFRR